MRNTSPDIRVAYRRDQFAVLVDNAERRQVVRRHRPERLVRRRRLRDGPYLGEEAHVLHVCRADDELDLLEIPRDKSTGGHADKIQKVVPRYSNLHHAVVRVKDGTRAKYSVEQLTLDSN